MYDRNLYGTLTSNLPQNSWNRGGKGGWSSKKKHGGVSGGMTEAASVAVPGTRHHNSGRLSRAAERNVVETLVTDALHRLFCQHIGRHRGA